MFAAYYGALLRALGHTAPDDGLARRLARANLDDAQVEAFPETRPVVERLRARGLRLAVVSNAWPSLERRFRALGLRPFFDPFVISTQVGASKPDPAIYWHAIDALGLPPESLLFVDDWPENVRAAVRLGLRGVAIARGVQAPPPPDVSWVSTLEGIEPLLA